MKITLSILILLTCISAKAQRLDDVISPQQSFNTFSLPDNDDTLHRPKVLSVYHVNHAISGTISVVGFSGSLVAYLTKLGKKQSITDAEFNGLNPSIISSLDSWALNQTFPANRNALETNALVTQIVVALAPLTLFADDKMGKDWGDLLYMILEVNAIDVSIYALSPLGPLFQNKFRPYVYYNNVPQSDRQTGWNRNSFYSGHVAAAATSTFFMAKVISDYYPDASKFLLYTAAAIPPLYLAYIRFIELEHFPSDLLTGFGIGMLCGILIPELHRNPNANPSIGFYSSPTSSGISMQVALK